MNISGLFHIGQSALRTAQQALTVTGHNIANVNTPGYSRQTVVQSELRPIDGHPGQFGTGVGVVEIQRSIDRFVEAALLDSHERLGRFDSLRSALRHVQGGVATSSGQGIGASLDDFFSAAQDVATNPADVTARAVLLSRAGTLAVQFNQAASTLLAQRQSLDREVGQTVIDVNRLAEEVARLNDQIRLAEGNGQQANDLRDQRGIALNELGNLIDLSTLEDASGQVTVFIGRGHALVSGNRALKLAGVQDPSNNGLLDVRYDGGTGATISLSNVIAGGRLRGLLDVRDQTIPAALASLDALASELVTQVNQQHRLGFGLDGSTGRDFFDPAGITAYTIAVALTDGRQIAASGTAAGVPGNNANMLALTALQHTTFASLGGATFGGHWSTLVSGIGTATQGAERDLQAQEIVQEHLDARRAEVSGVSLDEEMMKVLQYQRAFEAASRVILAADEMLQALLAVKR